MRLTMSRMPRPIDRDISTTHHQWHCLPILGLAIMVAMRPFLELFTPLTDASKLTYFEGRHSASKHVREPFLNAAEEPGFAAFIHMPSLPGQRHLNDFRVVRAQSKVTVCLLPRFTNTELSAVDTGKAIIFTHLPQPIPFVPTQGGATIHQYAILHTR